MTPFMRRSLALGLAAGCLLAPRALGAAPEAQEPPRTPAIQDGSTVQFDYTLTVDGQVVDASAGREPLRYVQGQGQIIPGLERQMAGLHAGDVRRFTVAPEDGYGIADPRAVMDVPRQQLPPNITPEVGQTLQGTSQDGQSFQAVIRSVGAESVQLDLNHPLAGKTLQFDVTVVTVNAP